MLLLLACRPEPPPPPEPVVPEVKVAEPPALKGTPVRGVYASVRDAATLLDHDAATTWSVAGDALGDRVEVYLEAPATADEVELQACPNGGPATWSVLVEGAPVGTVVLQAGQTGRVTFSSRSLGRFGLRLQEGDSPCLAEVAVRAGGAALPLAAPRAVPAAVRPSSIRAPAEAWHPWHLFDGRPGSAWSPGKSGGKGEELQIQLEAPRKLTAIELWPAPEAGRVTSWGLSLDKGGLLVFPTEPGPGPVVLPLPDRPITHLRLVVMEAERPPVALVELRLRDELGPLALATSLRAEREAITTGTGARPWSSFLDRRLVSGCGTGLELRLRANQDAWLSEPGVAAQGWWAVAGVKDKDDVVVLTGTTDGTAEGTAGGAAGAAGAAGAPGAAGAWRTELTIRGPRPFTEEETKLLAASCHGPDGKPTPPPDVPERLVVRRGEAMDVLVPK